VAERAYSDRRSDAGARSGPPPTPDLDDPNYYELLGVTFAASTEEIRRAYRTAMKEIHPDRQRAAGRARAEEAAKRLNRAYATLSKPAARQAYDQTIRAQVIQDQIMSRYVGGFMPEMQDQTAQQFRRAPSAADKREQARANRSAMVTLLTAFVVLAAVVIGVIVLFALIDALLTLAR
jgi:curved DNA-binding protein CbpA